jgi:serine/threonine protein kinase
LAEGIWPDVSSEGASPLFPGRHGTAVRINADLLVTTAEVKGLTISAQRYRGASLLRLGGAIDEFFDRDRLLEAAAVGTVIMDMGGITKVTSAGLRAWIDAVSRPLPGELFFVNCPPAVTAQFNMVQGFHGSGHLLSFYLPYLCPACDHAHEVLIDVARQFEVVRERCPPVVACPACQTPMTFDDAPESYFKHAATAGPVKVPPLVDAVLTDTAPGYLPSAQIEKDFDEERTVLWFSGALDGNINLKRVTDGIDRDVLVVFDDLEVVSEQGAQQFASLTARTDLALTVARVPTVMLAQAATSPTLFGRAEVVSLKLVQHCGECQTERRRDVEKADIADALAATCPRCGSAFQPLDELQALDKVTWRWSPLSAAIRGYLDRHPHRPSRDAGAVTPTLETLGRYALLKAIDLGGMAEVFLARQTGIGGFAKMVVVKRILPTMARDATFVSMFLDEARLAARISHPNVVQVLDVGQASNHYYIAMEYVRGINLNRLLRACRASGTRLPLGIALRIVADICAGLDAAHRSHDEAGRPTPIIHRDVSPHNVLLSFDGQVKLSDFGIAKAADDNRDRTPAQLVRGKATYIAPEVIGGSPADARADLFATGVVMYQCLTSLNPFQRPSEAATVEAILREPLKSPSQLREDLPAAVDAICMRALERDREQRYPSAVELKTDLEAVMARSGPGSSSADLAAWLTQLASRPELNPHLGRDLEFSPPDLDLHDADEPASTRSTVALSVERASRATRKGTGAD